MRVTTRAVFDIGTMRLLEWEGYDYEGPCEEAKRNQVKGQATGQMNLMNQLMQQAFGQQTGMANTITPYIKQLLASGQGFPPEMLAAMRTQALQGTGQAYQNAIGAVKQQLANRGLGGGATPVGGLYGQGFGQLLGQQAQTQSGLLGNIDIQNAQQRLQNIFSSAGALSNLGGMFNPGAFGQGASSALGDLTKLWTEPTIAGAIATQTAGNIEKGVAGAAAGGCWIAEAVYGENDIRTWILRAYLNGPFKWTRFGRTIMWLYLRFGRTIARFVRKSELAKRLFKQQVFDPLLPEARKWAEQ